MFLAILQYHLFYFPVALPFHPQKAGALFLYLKQNFQ